MISKSDKDIIAPCLWGADMDSLNTEGDKCLIIERVLEHGGDKQVRLILGHYTSEDMIKVVKESSYLSPRTVNYWCLYFKLEREKTKCYMKPSRHLWPPS